MGEDMEMDEYTQRSADDARLVELPQCDYDFDNGEFCLLTQDHPGPHTA